MTKISRANHDMSKNSYKIFIRGVEEGKPIRSEFASLTLKDCGYCEEVQPPCKNCPLVERIGICSHPESAYQKFWHFANDLSCKKEAATKGQREEVARLAQVILDAIMAELESNIYDDERLIK